MEERTTLPKIQSSNANKKTIKEGNQALQEVAATMSKDITTLNDLFYSTALVVTRQCGVKLGSKKPPTHKKPAWKRRIEKEIEQMRAEISVLEEVSRGSKVKSGKVTKLKRKYKIRELEDIPPIKETLKQKVQAKAQHMRRYEKREKFFRQTACSRQMQRSFTGN